MRKRSIVGIVILTIITCGIMHWVYYYQIMSDINYETKSNDSAASDLLLTIITCGLWGVYCCWKYPKKLTLIGAEDNSLLTVLLSVFGFQIISLCIMQSSINNLVDRNY